MSACMDIEYKSEERYSKITIGFSTDEEYEQINEALSVAKKGLDLEEMSYITNVSNGRRVMVIEYHDDYDRHGATICEKVMKSLNIGSCIV